MKNRRNFIKKSSLSLLGISILPKIAFAKKNDIKIHEKPNLNLNKNYHIKNFLKDHRVLMMSCIAALTLGGKWKIEDKDSIKTSFPKFINILKNLGANIN